MPNVKREYRSVSVTYNIFQSVFQFSLSFVFLNWVLDTTLTQPLLCEYSGHYFCSECHWGSLSLIPSRVVLNWDFQEYPVSKGSKQYLNLMMKKSIINLESINPKLFSFVEELAYVKVNKLLRQNEII